MPGDFYPDTLKSDLLPSPGAFPTIKLRAIKASFPKSTTTPPSVAACVRIGEQWVQTNVLQVQRSADSTEATITLAIPEGLPHKFGQYEVAVSIDNGTFVGLDRFYYVPRWGGVLATLLVFAVGHLFVWRLAISPGKRISELFSEGSLGKFSNAWFRGPNNLPSLSMFQIYLWTWVVICGFTFVAVQTGELFNLSSQVLWILGIAGIGSLSGRFLTIQNASPDDVAIPKFSDILRTDGKLDLYKLQMFIFTCFSAFWVSGRILQDQAFPVLNDNLLLLMGISNGLYVGSKVVPETPAEAVARLQREFDAAQAAIAGPQAEVTKLTSRLADMQANQAPPADINAVRQQLTAAQGLLTPLQARADTISAALNQARAKLANP